MAIINKKKYFASLAAATAIFLGSVSGFAFAQNATPQQQLQQLKPLAHVAAEELLRPGQIKDMVEGDENAPITIVEYASLTCSHCADFVVNTLPQIREKYINTGKVRIVFREFAGDDRAAVGFMLARCVPEDRYFPFIQLLFEKQAEWAFVPDAETPLKQLAKLAGIDDDKFKACVTDQKMYDALRANLKRGLEEFGVRATPTFFINGDPVQGTKSFAEMSALIDAKLKELGVSDAPKSDAQ
ncbi:DsbA family protein [Bartonella sp. HY329]|uniref:DsbA family protein n=1 Tax=unclassified Bartonella TaxID=2645622 RepID=UPI0021CA3566|nr:MULTISPECIES: DsbA family protein [unclassified Bartonella]UXM94158.1 DsbA family protein [Bartonella sp. HY329]UXN08480.1 DsbA family protein [Bartonella sp. HY328]